MRQPIPRLVAATASLLLVGVVLVGCGGGGEDDSLQQAMAQQFRIVVGLNESDSYCYAGELLDYYGEDEMQRFVDNPDNFEPSTPADQAVLIGALEACGIDPVSLRAGQGSGAEIDLEPVEDPAVGTAPGDAPASATTTPG